jgi:hypothetical protein
MGGMVMGKCKDKQRKSCIAQTNYKYFQGGYGKLQLGDVYTCRGFFQIMYEFEKVDSITFFNKLIKQFLHKGFGNPWQLVINKIHETQKMTICNSMQVSLGATIIKEQNVKTFSELSYERIGLKTTKDV